MDLMKELANKARLEETDTDLLNIRDEMLGVLNQTKYRLHMM